MHFTTITFWAVFVVFLMFFILIRRATKKGMMLYVTAFSLVFYYLSNGLLMVVLPAVALFTWWSTRLMSESEGTKRKRLMWFTVIVDLLPLLVFKYTGMAVDIWNAILQSNFSFGTITVPAGLSFFTFQAISYVVDVYKGKFTDRVSLLEFFFYLTFFPLLVAGPITRAEVFFSHFRGETQDEESAEEVAEAPAEEAVKETAEEAVEETAEEVIEEADEEEFEDTIIQIAYDPEDDEEAEKEIEEAVEKTVEEDVEEEEASEPRFRGLPPVDPKLLYTGLWLIMLGLVKKLVVADYIAQFNNMVFEDPTALSGFENLMGCIGFSVQIYCDFSGLSDLAIGMAALLGIALPDNFNLPYQSLNITEFWRRWHMSLSFWFRDYVYIPLGGNRKGKIRTYVNNFLTIFLSGIWHGSTPMFALWGAIHGAGLVVHKACKSWLDKIPDNWLTKPFTWVITYAFLLVTWVFFRAGSLETCWQIFGKVFTDMDLAYLVPFVTMRGPWTFVVVGTMLVHATRRETHHRFIDWYVESPLVVKIVMFAMVIQLCIQMSTSTVAPFLYEQF